jgi:excisionase family DNA binding protein
VFGPGDDPTRRMVHGAIGARQINGPLALADPFTDQQWSGPMRNRDEPIDEEAPTGVFEPPRAPPVARAPVITNLDGLWDANDVARYLKVSRSWVYHRAEAGQLPCVRVGGLLRFDPATIRASARGEVTATRRVVAFAKNRRG